MKYTVFICFAFLLKFSIGQGLSEAKLHFDRFEYNEVIKIFEEKGNHQKLDLDGLKYWAYSYYAIGDYEKALPLIDSILQFKPIEPFFYYMQGEVKLAAKDFDHAVKSYEQYRKHDQSIHVENRILSAREMKNWPTMDYLRIDEFEWNHDKAISLGNKIENHTIVFREIGIDKNGNKIEDSDKLINSELLLMRPFVLLPEMKAIELVGSEKFWSIHDISLHLPTNTAFITISKPFAAQLSDRVHQVYIGKWDAKEYKLSIEKPWSITADFLSVANASFNESGSIVVFSATTADAEASNLYFSQFNEGQWSSPSSIASINTTMNEMYPRFSGDTLLYFSSNGRVGYGGLDIYSIQVDNTMFLSNTLQHLPYPINSSRDDFNLISENDSTILVTTNRLAKTADDNVMAIILPSLIEEGEDIVEIEDPNKAFIAKWALNHLYFPFDKYEIKEDEELNFEDLKIFLSKNPDFKISLTGKTDERGSEQYNYQLGLKRAETVKRTLVDFGIPKDQIITSSKGKSEPIIDCTGGCSEAEHAKNRTVVMELIY